jgi:glycosyltransferase involved in cell wall biosynthesis
MPKEIKDLPLPFVSVIVPTFNLPVSTDQCLQALQNQSYPKEKYEVIVVDNASTDETPGIIEKYAVKMLVQTELKSPYPSRNMGIKEAKGEIIALIDAKCIPDHDWIEGGINTLKENKADLAGGAIIFTFSHRKTGAEIYDALTNIRMKESIEERNVAKTGSLFAYKYVYDKIGLFPLVRSGGDVMWTGRATRNGFKLVYAEKAKAYYAARGLEPLVKKQYRVGKGQPLIWLREGKSRGSIWKIIFRTTASLLLLRTPSISYLRRRIEETGGGQTMHKKIVSVFMAGWLCSAAMNLGRINYMLTHFNGKPDV